MNIEDLQRFCSKDLRHIGKIDHPFLQGGKVWATDGHVIIGVRPFFGATKNPDAPDVEKVRPNTPPGEWFQIPEVEVEPCIFCKAAVKDFTCPECNGIGRLDLKTQWHAYEQAVSCASCDEVGEIEFCPYCSGTGVNAKEMTEIGGVTFKNNMLVLIRDLPGIQISPTGPTSPAYLRFDDGGEGYLMPGVSTK